MKREALSNILQVLYKGLSDILGDQLEAVYLYGSQARGDAHAGSDIDVLIVVRNSFDYDILLEKTLDLTASLSLKNDVVISRVFVSKDRFENEMNPFLMNVRRESITL